MQRNLPKPEPKGTEIFLHCVLEVWIVGNQGAWNCKSFPLKAGFLYVQVPFKTGFTAFYKANAIPRYL